jgi:hypothetical protein
MRLALQACAQALTRLVKDAQEARDAAAAAAVAAAAAAQAEAAPAQCAGREGGPSQTAAVAEGQAAAVAVAGTSRPAAGPAAAVAAAAPLRRVGMRQMGAALSGLTGGIGVSNQYVQVRKGKGGILRDTRRAGRGHAFGIWPLDATCCKQDWEHALSIRGIPRSRLLFLQACTDLPSGKGAGRSF